jgi:hypothetical protein
MNLELKMKNTDLDTFLKLVKDQFTYGGKKYAKTKTKESTDVLFERHTHRWLVGTIDKYTFRYANLARERDILKIATYMYILWLKRGFHLNVSGVSRVINTTVDIKTKNFIGFSDKVNDYTEKSKYTTRLKALHYSTKGKGTMAISKINFISNMMRTWSRKSFISITQQEIVDVFNACYFEWLEKYSNVDEQKRDKDTWNELSKQLVK